MQVNSIPYEPVKALVKRAKEALKNDDFSLDQKYAAVGNVFKDLSSNFKEYKMIFPNVPRNQPIKSSLSSDIKKSAFEKMKDAGCELHVILGDVRTKYPNEKALQKAQNLMEKISNFVILSKIQNIITQAKIDIIVPSQDERLSVLSKTFDKLSETIEPLVTIKSRYSNVLNRYKGDVSTPEEGSFLDSVNKKGRILSTRVADINNHQAELAILNFLQYATDVIHLKYKTGVAVAKNDSSACGNFIKVVAVVACLAIFAKQIL